MSTSNKVFQVLVTSGNQAILAKGSKIETLKPGQLGFFDADTNLAIDGTETPTPASFYIAQGLGSGATATDIRTSAGQEIQTRNIKNFTLNKNTAGTPTIIDITGIKANCGENYSLKIEARSLAIFNIYGFRPFFQTYAVQTSCCEGCEPCPSGNKAELAGKLVKKVNSDPAAFVTATLLVDGAPVASTNTDINAFIANPANKDKAVGIRITSKANANYNVNGAYTPIQGFDGAAISAFLGSGFDCNGTVTLVQAGTMAEGLGHFIREKEYVAGGYNGNPGIYRTSGQFNESYPEPTLLAQEGTKYDQINLVYDHHSKSGWLDYLNDMNTLIAVPVADTVTSAAILGVLSKLGASVGMRTLTGAEAETSNT